MSTAEVAQCRWKAWARDKAGSETPLQREVHLLLSPERCCMR